ncbi:MAG: M50 family metallopeptidase [bacterium]
MFENLMLFFISVVVLLSMLSIIVFIHEFGHFQVARWCKVKVDVFSIGFGKPLWRQKDKHGTEWRISMLPLGGYVRFFGDAGPASSPSSDVQQAKDSDQEESAKPITTQFPDAEDGEALEHILTEEEKKVCFHFKPLWQKALIVAAGPFANFLLAIIIFWGFIWGYGIVKSDIYVGEVLPDSPAMEAGFQPGDLVLQVDKKRPENFTELSQYIMTRTGERLNFLVYRDGQNLSLIATPRREEQTDMFGNIQKVGLIGISWDQEKSKTYRVKVGPIRALGRSVDEVWTMLATSVRFLGRIVSFKEDIRQLGGPVKIGKMAGQAATYGSGEEFVKEYSFPQLLSFRLQLLLQLAAMVSVSLGFMNLLPIPALDGGHLALYGYEAVVGKPLNEKIMTAGFKIGIVILLSLMVFVTVNDISQTFF